MGRTIPRQSIQLVKASRATAVIGAVVGTRGRHGVGWMVWTLDQSIHTSQVSPRSDLSISRIHPLNTRLNTGLLAPLLKAPHVLLQPNSQAESRFLPAFDDGSSFDGTCPIGTIFGSKIDVPTSSSVLPVSISETVKSTP